MPQGPADPLRGGLVVLSPFKAVSLDSVPFSEVMGPAVAGVSLSHWSCCLPVFWKKLYLLVTLAFRYVICPDFAHLVNLFS